MKSQSKSLLLSLMVHSLLFLIAVAVTSNAVNKTKTVVIDFSVIDSSQKPAPVPELKQPDKPVKHEISKAKNREPDRVVSMPPPKEQDLPATVTPKPATETAGPVPINAPAEQPAQAVQQQPVRVPALAGTGRVSEKAANEAGKSPEQITSRYVRQHFEHIRDHIQKNIVYPAMARRLGLTGKVVVSFVVMENGHVTDEKILVSSGHKVLDNNVIDTIRQVEPFPKPPIRAELRIPILYRVK